MRQLMTRQEMWRQKYRLRPYLQHCKEEEVAERLRYVIENMTTLTSDRKVAPLAPEPHGKYWFELFEHVQEEYRRRGDGAPEGFLKDAQVPHPADPISSAAIRAVQRASVPADRSHLIKFGMHEHMLELYNSGRLRIAPATSYSDASLNPAIHDDELLLSSFGQQSEVLIEVFDAKTGQPMAATKPIGNIKYTSRSKTDYFVLCLGKRLDARLFRDFGYDACLILRDPEEFKRRLGKAVEARLPDWIGVHAEVRYLDPFNCHRGDMDVYFGKHLKYWYQHEYRCVWVPKPPPVIGLDPFFVDLGSMREISTLIELDQA